VSTESLIVALYLLSGLGIGFLFGVEWFGNTSAVFLAIGDTSPPKNPIFRRFVYAAIFVYPPIFPILGTLFGKILGDGYSQYPIMLVCPAGLAIVALLFIRRTQKFPGSRPNIIIRWTLIFFRLIWFLTFIPWLIIYPYIIRGVTRVSLARDVFASQKKFYPPRITVIDINTDTVNLPLPFDGKLRYRNQAALCCLDLRTGKRETVTSSCREKCEFLWHPSGRAMLTTPYEVLDSHIYLWDTKTHKIMWLIGAASDPKWNSDGSKIGFKYRNSGRGREDIYILDIASQKLTLYSGRYSAFAWSPDGRYIALVKEFPTDLLLIDLHDSKRDLILLFKAPSVRYPTWSPDSQQIAFVGDRSNIFVVSINDGSMQQLTNFSKKQLSFGDTFAWSPDGTRLVFTGRETRKQAIYTVSMEDGNVVAITDGLTWDYTPLWNPSGEYIAFLREEKGLSVLDNRHPGTYGIYVIRSADKTTHRLVGECSALLAWDA
jgi:Tol biopolymer transport system component